MPFSLWGGPFPDLTKACADNTHAAIVAMHDLGVRMWRLTLDQSLWMTEESQRATTAWIEACRRSGETLQQALDGPFPAMHGRASRKGERT